MKNSMSWRIFCLCAGGYIIGMAISLCSRSGWGADPITVFYDGLSKSMNIPYGTASNVTAYMMILMTCLFNYKNLGFGTLIVPFFTQFGIDAGMVMFGSTLGVLSFFQLITGFILLAFGISATIFANLGKNSYDALIFSLSVKSHLQYHQMRWVLDAVLLICGSFMGGSLSIANFLAALILGKLITFFNYQFDTAANWLNFGRAKKKMS